MRGGSQKINSINTFLIPFDKGVISRPGSRFAPSKIKEYLLKLNFKNKELLNFFEIDLQNFDTYRAHEHIIKFIKEKSDNGFNIFIGGDHSITYATVKAIRDKFENLLIINLDKHFDIRDWSIYNISSGTSFSRLLDEGIIKIDELVEIGILDFHNSESLFKKAKGYGFRFITMFEIKRKLNESLKLLEEILDKFDNVYLSLDVDVIDASICPGSSASFPFGLNYEEILKIIDTILKTKKLKALDIVEVNPLVDFDDITSKFSAFILAYIISQVK